MGWYEDFLRGAGGGPSGLPQGPFGGPADPFGTALGEAGLPGGGGLPPSPFGGGAGGWPTGVPNPFGLPSPGDMAQTIGNWFSNPYNNHGSAPNPSPYGGINPYGTQVSGGNTNPWDPKSTGATYRPNDPNALQSGWTFQPGVTTTGRPNDPWASGDTATTPGVRSGWNTPKAPPKLTQFTQSPPMLERWGGGIGTGTGLGGFRHQQGQASVGGPPNWHDVPLWQGSK